MLRGSGLRLRASFDFRRSIMSPEEILKYLEEEMTFAAHDGNMKKFTFFKETHALITRFRESRKTEDIQVLTGTFSK
jgi:hypothetical protein